MREIRYITVHCTATSQTTTVESILRYWREKLGWGKPGYHLVIPANGKTQRLAPDTTVCNGVAGYNSHALHVSYIGGVDTTGKPVDNRTPAQRAELIRIVKRWLAQYPAAQVLGHRDFPRVAKSCPSFDVRGWWASVLGDQPK